MRGQSKSLMGMFCISIGVAIILSIILPSWMWLSLIALSLIGSGVFLFFY